MTEAKNTGKEVNFVHQGQIRTESINKEKKFEGKNFKYDFTFKVDNLYPFAEKPQLVAPDRPFTNNDTIKRRNNREYQLNKDPIKDAFVKEKIHKAIISNQQIPKDKYEYPMTSAQEIGWYSKPLVDNSKWHHPVSSTPISDYVNNYYITMGINPFKLPSSTLKMK